MPPVIRLLTETCKDIPSEIGGGRSLFRDQPDGKALAFVTQCKKQMLRPDVAVSHADGDTRRLFNDLFCTRRNVRRRQLARAADSDVVGEKLLGFVVGHASFAQYPFGDAVLFGEQTEQKMFASHAGMPHFGGDI